MKELKPADIIEWFKMKSREYAQTAARLEKDFDMTPSDLSLSNTEPKELAPLESITKFLKSVGAKRPADIADHIKSTKEAVLATVEANPTILEKAQKGWIKLKEGESL